MFRVWVAITVGLVAYLILALLCVDYALLSYCVCCSLCFVDFEFLCA